MVGNSRPHRMETFHPAQLHTDTCKHQDLVYWEHKPTFERGAIVPFAARALHRLGFDVLQIDPLVVSIKTALGNLKRMHRLQFDFRIPGEPSALIEVLQSKRLPSREKLRYLMARARLVRYEVNDQGIERLYQTPRLYLFLNGNLAGPDHDPFRYVRALLSVGLDVYRSYSKRDRSIAAQNVHRGPILIPAWMRRFIAATAIA
jgi:hypothetical protein